MTRSINRVDNNKYRQFFLYKSGGNTLVPHREYGGFNFTRFDLLKPIPVTVVTDIGGRSSEYDGMLPIVGEHYKGTFDVITFPTYPSDIGFGADLQLRAQIAKSDFSALITAMEMKSTIVGIGNLAHRLGNAYGALSRGNLKGFTQALDVSSKSTGRIPARKVRENAASYLLEYQFGIVSLYNDILGLATTLYDQSQFPARKRVKATEKREVTEVVTAYVGTSAAWTDGIDRLHSANYHTGSAKSMCIYKAACDVVVDSPLEYYLSRFGFTNPIHAAYSVAPNSWLFDAFIPLGDFLSQLYLPPGISLKNQGVTKVLESELKFPLVYGIDQASYYPYSVPLDEDTRFHGELKAYQVVESCTGKYVSVSMSPADFTGISFQIRPKLPFVGQAITSSAYAHQRSEDLKSLLRRNKS